MKKIFSLIVALMSLAVVIFFLALDPIASSQSSRLVIEKISGDETILNNVEIEGRLISGKGTGLGRSFYWRNNKLSEERVFSQTNTKKGAIEAILAESAIWERPLRMDDLYPLTVSETQTLFVEKWKYLWKEEHSSQLRVVWWDKKEKTFTERMIPLSLPGDYVGSILFRGYQVKENSVVLLIETENYNTRTKNSENKKLHYITLDRTTGDKVAYAEQTLVAENIYDFGEEDASDFAIISNDQGSFLYSLDTKQSIPLAIDLLESVSDTEMEVSLDKAWGAIVTPVFVKDNIYIIQVQGEYTNIYQLDTKTGNTEKLISLENVEDIHLISITEKWMAYPVKKENQQYIEFRDMNTKEIIYQGKVTGENLADQIIKVEKIRNVN